MTWYGSVSCGASKNNKMTKSEGKNATHKPLKKRAFHFVPYYRFLI